MLNYVQVYKLIVIMNWKAVWSFIPCAVITVKLNYRWFLAGVRYSEAKCDFILGRYIGNIVH